MVGKGLILPLATPPQVEDLSPEVRYRRTQSEFTDTADHRRSGANTWQDCVGTVRDYGSP